MLQTARGMQKVVPPYRESLLTKLLQSSLQPSLSSCLMIVNIQQDESSGWQTKESLEFASAASRS